MLNIYGIGAAIVGAVFAYLAVWEPVISKINELTALLSVPS